jgi:hypothetical protein
MSSKVCVRESAGGGVLDEMELQSLRTCTDSDAWGLGTRKIHTIVGNNFSYQNVIPRF